MVVISDRISESLSEYLILTGWIKEKPENVSLNVSLGDIKLQYPFITSRMQSVVGPEMAVAAGRQGILTIVPRSLRDEDKQRIIDANNRARLKKGDIEFQDNPIHAHPDMTFESVKKKIDRTGHSVIPIIDRKSKLYGFYIHDPDNPPMVSPKTPISGIMTRLKQFMSDDGIPYLVNTDDRQKIKEKLEREEIKFIPIVDDNMILQKIAFLQKSDTNYIGIVITTKAGWRDEIERWGPQVDTMCIDSSNACFDDALEILEYAKKRFPYKPFGVGNIIKAEDFKIFAKAGADYILGGMGVGSICQTGSRRGNGRGQMTVAMELAKARDEFYEETGVYVAFVLDGGINNVKDISVALAFADFVMMGNYFNKFIEAPGKKYDSEKNVTTEEALIHHIESWGEGHPKARLVAMYGLDFKERLHENKGHNTAIERYGHSRISAATTEGVAGLVKCRGRLKPCVESDARYLRTTIANTGASNLKEFRQMAVIEKASAMTLKKMLPHDMEVEDWD